jgi:hypothetical protein
MSAVFSSKAGSLLAIYRSSRCGFSRVFVQMRWIVVVLSPVATAIFLHDQWVLPSDGFCCVFFSTRACTAAVTRRGRLPLCRPSSPAIRASSKRAFQRAMVGLEVFRSDSIRL